MAEQQDLAAELAEAKWLLGRAALYAPEPVFNDIRAFLTRPAPASDKGEVERLREALANIHRYANGYLHHAETRAIAYEVMLKCTAALTPAAPDAAEKPSRADALQAAIDNAGLDVSVCSECGRVVACIPDGMPMCEKCATAEAGQKGGE